MKLPKLFKKRLSKREKRELELIKDFENGKILHIDDNVDNKEIFSKE